jgi:phosphatidate cytidylyltransferase
MSNLTLRILTAVVAIPLIVLVCIAGGIYFFTFIALISAVALSEYYSLARAKGARPLTGAGILSGLLINLSFYHAKLQLSLARAAEGTGMAFPFPSQAQLLVIILILVVAGLSLIELFRNEGSALLNLSATLFGLFYISLFFGTLIGIRELFVPLDFPMARFFTGASNLADPSTIDHVYRWGGYTVVSIFATIWICDSAAFHVGSAIGRHKLFPRVSPNKSWEGALAGFFSAVASSVAAKFLLLEYLTPGAAVVIGVLVGVFGQTGDLIESLLKRDAGVKDSSHLIPGHGGAFDRFDSLLLVAPLVYLYLDFFYLS